MSLRAREADNINKIITLIGYNIKTIKLASCLLFSYLYNKRACPQTMFKILRLRRQHCQIKRITGLPKTWR
jgi:hypothetical protein